MKMNEKKSSGERGKRQKLAASCCSVLLKQLPYLGLKVLWEGRQGAEEPKRKMQ
jgi:hypothetical protein